jgi:hypothetical protein
MRKMQKFIFVSLAINDTVLIVVYILQSNALLATLELKELAGHDISKPAGAYLSVSEGRYREIPTVLSCLYLTEILTR